MATKKTPVKRTRSLSRVPIPNDQWNLPAGYKADGRHFATLAEVASPGVRTLSLGELSEQQRRNLVAKRIEAQPKFELAMLGVGVVDKERAVAEVRAGTTIGRNLEEIEQRVINHMLSQAQSSTEGEAASAHETQQQETTKAQS